MISPMDEALLILEENYEIKKAYLSGNIKGKLKFCEKVLSDKFDSQKEQIQKPLIHFSRTFSQKKEKLRKKYQRLQLRIHTHPWRTIGSTGFVLFCLGFLKGYFHKNKEMA